jgi:multidrug efflux pump subunit AcrA (membrane-fusion protein)
MTQSTDAAVAPRPHWLSRVLRLLMVLGILAAGAALAWHWLANPPKADRRPPKASATLVEVETVQRETHRVVVRAMGTVMPAKAVVLSPQVAGRIVATTADFLPGGLYAEGAEVLKIEPDDYRLGVAQLEAEVQRLAASKARSESTAQMRETDLVKAEASLRVEMGQQSVAQREYELLGQTVQPEDRELVLRGPALDIARSDVASAKAALAAARAETDAAAASLASARAALEKARLDLERTTVRSPFNALVQRKDTSVGSQVSPSTPLAHIVGTDEYWVEATVAVDQLRYLSIPQRPGEAGSPVRVFCEAAGDDACRNGEVLRLVADLETLGRMARVLVSVRDPLGLEAGAAERPPLLLGSYVRLELEGADLPNVVRVPRTALRDGRHVWVMAADGTLDIRPVRVVWSGSEHVFVADAVTDGDRLVTSELAAPVQGMALRAAGDAQTAAGDAQAAGGDAARPEPAEASK